MGWVAGGAVAGLESGAVVAGADSGLAGSAAGLAGSSCRLCGWARRRRPGGWGGIGVGLGDELNIEDEVGLGGDGGWAAVFTVGELVGDVEATFAADVHALEAGVPAGDNLARPVGEGDGLATVDGGVELGAVGEPAGVVDGVVTALLGEGASADDDVDVAEGVERLGCAINFGDVGRVVGGVGSGGYGLCCCCRCGGGGCVRWVGGGGVSSLSGWSGSGLWRYW